MFDTIIEHIINDLALQGDQGCSWDLFWSLVENAVKENTALDNRNLKVNVDRAYQAFLWNYLKTQPDLLVYSNGQLIEMSDILYHTLESQKDLVFKAKEELQDLNIYGKLSHLKNTIPKICHQMLCHIAKSKQKGVSQFHVGKLFDLDSKKVFHYMKRLQTEGLIVRQSAYAENMRTNLIYLSRFAPSLDNEEDELEASDVIYGYDVFRIRVLNQLKEAKDQMLSLADLVSSFGFRTQRKIRWARVAISRLHQQGDIEKFMAFDGKIKQSCIRLKSSLANRSSEPAKPTHPERPFLRDYSCEYQVYQSIVDAGEKGITRAELMALYPYLYSDYYIRLTSYLCEPPKNKEMEPWLVYKAETTEGRQTLYRYFALQGWKKYQEKIQTFVTNPAEQKPALDFAPSPTLDPVILPASPKAESVKRVSTGPSPPMKKARSSLPNATKVRRRSLLIDLMEQYQVREFNADLLKEFIEMELAAGGQPMAKKTLSTLIETLQTEGKLKIWVTSVQRPSGLQELKTFLIHPTLSVESETVQDFVERYRFDWAADPEPSRRALTQVEVNALPGKKKDLSNLIHKTKNTWHLGFAADYGYIRSKFLRAQILHQWFFMSFGFTVDRRRILPQMPLKLLLRLCLCLPYNHATFVSYLKEAAHQEVILAHLPTEIQALLGCYQARIRAVVHTILCVLKSLALIQPVDRHTSTAYLLSKEGFIRNLLEKGRPVISCHPLTTQDEIEDYWLELRNKSLEMESNTVILDSGDPLRTITSGRGWAASAPISSYQKKRLQEYVNPDTLTSPLGDKALCCHLGKQLGMSLRLVKRYFRGTINSLISARLKGLKQQTKKVIHPSPAISQLIKMSREQHQCRLPTHALEPTFIGSRSFRSDRIKVANCVEEDLQQYKHPTPKRDPFSPVEKDILCYAYCIMAYRSKQYLFYWNPITQVIPNRASEKCRRILCSMMARQPGMRTHIRQLSLIWEYLYTHGIRNGDIKDERPFDTQKYDLVYFLEYFLVQLQLNGNSLLQAIQPYDLPPTTRDLYDRFSIHKDMNYLQVAPSQSLRTEGSFIHELSKESKDPSLEVIKTLIKILFVSPVETYSSKEAHQALRYYPEDLLERALSHLRQEGLMIAGRSSIRRIPGRLVNVSIRFLDLARPRLPIGLCRQAGLFYNQLVETRQVELTRDTLSPKQFMVVLGLLSEHKVSLDFKSREKYLCTKRGSIRPKPFASSLLELYVQRYFDVKVQCESDLIKFEPFYPPYEQTRVLTTDQIMYILDGLENPDAVKVYHYLQAKGKTGLTWTELKQAIPSTTLSGFQCLMNHEPPLVKLVGFHELRYITLGNIQPWLFQHSATDPILWCDLSGGLMPTVFEGCLEVVMSHLIQKPGISFSTLRDILAGFLSAHEVYTILDYLLKHHRIKAVSIKTKNQKNLFGKKQIICKSKQSFYTDDNYHYWPKESFLF